jgi:glycosyltransferase involved in cell wall biosynthesis
MKVLFILDRPNMYGSELHVLSLLKEISINKNLQASLITFSEGPLLVEIEKLHIPFSVIKIKWFPNIMKFCLLLNTIKKIRPDILHLHQPKAGLIGSIAAQLLSVPSVYTLHSKPNIHTVFRKCGLNYLIYFFHYVVNFSAQTLAKHLIFVSNEMLRRSHYPRKSMLIYNWISIELEHHHATHSILNNNNPVRLLCVGSIVYGKGHDLVLITLNLLRLKGIKFIMTFVGDIWDKLFFEKLKQDAKFFNIDTNIIWKEYSNDISDYYMDNDVFILLSRSESFGIVYAEAMFFGLPVVCSDMPVSHEIVGKCGCISNNPNEHVEFISKLFYDREYYKSLSTKCSKHSRKSFTRSENMNKTFAVYESIK